MRILSNILSNACSDLNITNQSFAESICLTRNIILYMCIYVIDKIINYFWHFFQLG